jgi:tetratricopeptide (TPR) repeat protein
MFPKLPTSLAAFSRDLKTGMAGILLTMVLCGCDTVLHEAKAPSSAHLMSYTQARRQLKTALASAAGFKVDGHIRRVTQNTRFEVSRDVLLIFPEDAASWTLNLQAANYVEARSEWLETFLIEGTAFNHEFSRYWIAWPKGTHDSTAASAASALNVLITRAKTPGNMSSAAEFAEFKEKAIRWRTEKPPFPPEADRQRILAENALKERDIERALEHFEEALAVAPFWAEGYFNAAMISGETGAFREAADHMRRYLELAPDDPDAEAAREKMIIWDEKNKRPSRNHPK